MTFSGVRHTGLNDEGLFYKQLWKLCNSTFMTWEYDLVYELLEDDHAHVMYYLHYLESVGKKRHTLWANPYVIKDRKYV